MHGSLTAHNAFSVMGASSLPVQTICGPLLQWSSELVKVWGLPEPERARGSRDGSSIYIYRERER
eukprot:3523200-Pyramimonas_sp.AAC.1